MQIQANISIEVDHHTVLAEIATGAKRPELRKICQAFRTDNDSASLETLRAALPAQEIVLNAGKPYEERFNVQLNDRGLNNLLQLLADLELIKDGKLTPLGRDLCDDLDAKVPVAEHGAFRLATFHHEACGLQVQSLHRIPTLEIRGPEFQTLQDQATYELDPLHVLKKYAWYETVEKPQRFKFLGYAGGEPRCIQHPTSPKYLRVALSNDTGNSPGWQLVASPSGTDDSDPRPSAALEKQCDAIIESILLQAPLGKWDGAYLAVEFDAATEPQRKSFEADFTVDDIEAVLLGHVVRASCVKIPLRPASQDAAAHWVKELALNYRLISPTTRSQFVKLMEANMAGLEARFKKMQATVPANSLLAQAHLATNDPSRLPDYWHLQAPLDLAPREAAELDSPVDVFAPSQRRPGNVAQSTGLTIEHHQLLEYPELLEALWDVEEAPAEILLCDRHMFAHPQSIQLPRLLEAIQRKWPNAQIELWYSDHKDFKNDAQLIADCRQQGFKAQTTPAPIRGVKIHDRFLLLKHPVQPLAVWGASNSLLSARNQDGKLLWPQVNLTRMKPQQAHTQIQNWAK
jgi:hypothetical protein